MCETLLSLTPAGLYNATTLASGDELPMNLAAMQQTSPLNVRRIGGVAMAGNLALASFQVTQEPHRNRDSKSSAAHCFCHAKYTCVADFMARFAMQDFLMSFCQVCTE